MSMETITKDYSHIKGWGVDADPKNDPTYPMKHRTNEEHDGYSWQRPTQQAVNIEVLHSNERSNITAVFGTALPPKGLSGKIRRFAFKYGEGSYGHWLPLILADRIDVVEGIANDIRHGHFPNIFAEKGMKASWKYDRKGIVQRTMLLMGILASSVTIAVLSRKNLNLREA